MNETFAEWRARCDATSARLEASTHYVYRAYDSAGRLLYVGCTVNPSSRMTQHRSESHWWGFVAELSLEHFPTRPAARAAEAEAIQTEGAYFNRMPGNQFTSTTPSTVGLHAYLAALESDVAA